jgi:PAS domain-containing protein
LLNHIRRAFKDQMTQYMEELEMALVEQTAKLEVRDEQFRQFGDHINEVFWISSPDQSEVLYVSQSYETVWGRSCASLLEDPRSLWGAIHPQDHERILAHQPEAQVAGFQGECRIVRPDKSVRWIRAQTFPIRNQSGKSFAVVGWRRILPNRSAGRKLSRKPSANFANPAAWKPLGLWQVASPTILTIF